MKTLACYSMKGGVGKTAAAVNIAAAAAAAGQRVLLIDLDPQGASSFYFRVKPKKKSWDGKFFKAYKDLLGHIKASDFDNLDILPAHFSFREFDVNLDNMKKPRKRLASLLRGFKSQYDLIVLDCPPTISRLAEAVFEAAEYMVVPVIPTTLSERTLALLYDYFRDNDLKPKMILPFFSMVQKQKTMHSDTMQRLGKQNKRLLKSQIPFSAEVEKMGDHRAPLAEFAPNCNAAKAFAGLWGEVDAILEKR